jgi:carbon monoxide dehydrogenase subunit G
MEHVMEVSGQIRTTCTADQLVSALSDAAALQHLLPSGSSIEKAEDGTFAFSVSRNVGPIRLTLPGTMALTPTGENHDQQLTARASHVIGGRVSLDLALRFTQSPGQTRLAYAGELVATGLAGRIMRERQARVETELKSALTRLKLFAEKRHRSAPQPGS